MFEGADYVMTEIIWWMTASAVVGFLLGWVVRRFFLSRRHQRKLHAAEMRIAELEERLAAAEDDHEGDDSRPRRRFRPRRRSRGRRFRGRRRGRSAGVADGEDDPATEDG